MRKTTASWRLTPSPGFFAAMGLPAVGSYSRGIREYAMGE